LRAGEHLSQVEFHRRYEAYPEDVKFELIDGVVYMASPLHRPHGKYHHLLGGVLFLYEKATPGVEGLDNTTTILSQQDELQPDLSLRILTEHGGQSRVDEQERIVDAPELVAEVASSSEDVDLGSKRRDYERTGVCEYLVLCLGTQELRWFDFHRGREIRSRGGIYRSRVFPGMWLDGPALLGQNLIRLDEVIQQGIASSAHARFLARLARAHRRLSRGQ
jgi:Uma2 family endonuclease